MQFVHIQEVAMNEKAAPAARPHVLENIINVPDNCFSIGVDTNLIKYYSVTKLCTEMKSACSHK